MKRPITILFDAHPILGQKTGIGYYVSQLVLELSKNYPHEIELVGYYHNSLNRKKVTNLPKANNIKYKPITLIPGQLVNLLRRIGISLPIELLTLTKTDFIFYTNFWGPPSIFNIRSIPFIYDLSFFDYPEFGSAKNMSDLNKFVPKIIKNASFVVTISSFSKDRISSVFNVNPKNIIITSIPPSAPISVPTNKTKKILKEYNLSGNFILFVGTLEPRKNLINLLDAYTRLPKSIREKYSLVIAGKSDWKYEKTIKKINSLISNGYDIKYLGYVNDDVKSVLYSKAGVFVLPSVYEGFGMPVLEAFSYGLPCVISNIPVFKEVAGDSAIYFDPNKPGDIGKAIELAIATKNKTQQEKLKKYVMKNFSWKQQADVLVGACKRILNV